MSHNFTLYSDNIAIVQVQDSDCLAPSIVEADDLPELYGTVSLSIAQSKAIDDDQYTSVNLLFGSWIESGDEDKHLEELYSSRRTFSK